MLELLRRQADALLIGAGTMRAERYGPPTADPLTVVVSGSLDLPWDAELFSCGRGKVLIHTSSPLDPPPTATPVSVVRHEGRVDLAAMMRDLRANGVRALLTEGGPALHAELLALGLLDELFVTVAPKLGGDADAPRLLEGRLGGVAPLELVWALEEDGELFLRYRIGSQ